MITIGNDWLTRIITKLFEPEDRYLDRLVVNLNQANSEVKGKEFVGFVHMGVAHIPLANRTRRPRGRPNEYCPTLDFTLLGQAEQYIQQRNRVKLDRDQIRQALFHLLCQCSDMQEIRNVLPDCIVAMFPALSAHRRTVQDPLYMVRSNKPFVEQYQKLLPKIEYYAMSRMLY